MAEVARQQDASSDRSTGSEETDQNLGRSASRTWMFRGLGVALAVVVYLLMGGADVSGDARVIAALGTLMAVFWMTEAMPLAATSLIPIVLFPVFTERTVAETTAPYANPIVFLFLGGFLIAIAMQKWQLHRRIALRTLSFVGTKPRQIILGMMITTAFLSMWVSNTATTLMMLPIAISVLAVVVEKVTRGESGAAAEERLQEGAAVSDVVDDKNVRVFGVALVLAIAWSASIGGLGTLLGSPPNAIVAGYVGEELGESIGFARWMMMGVPLVVVFLLLAWLVITLVMFRFDLPDVPGGKEAIEAQLHELGPMTQGEKMVAAVFGLAAACWVLPSLIQEVVGEGAPAFLDLFDDTAVAIGAGLLLFLLPGDKEGRMVSDWGDAERGLPWGVLLLFGGGLSLAAAVAATGLDSWFGDQVSGLGALPVVLLIAAVVTLVLFLTEITSNTATAATFIPILGGVALGLGIDPMVLLIPAAFAATCAFMLPVGTPPNAIVFATGTVKIQEMARGGFVLNILGCILITLATVILGPFALGLVL
jgi:solute carrier family 13 (sodium-dependent dicarboxylate transporter), member 2/3/5